MEEVIKIKTEEEIVGWFKKDLLPGLVKEGRFPVPGCNPENLTFSEIKWESTERFTDHFASCPYFVTLCLTDKTNASRTKSFPIIIKFITQNMATRAAMDTDTQFYNEMVLYNEVLPSMRKFLKDKTTVPPSFIEELCPVCYYAKIDLKDPDYAVVVLNDLRIDGFNPAKSKVELDYDHFKVAFEQLARFHALSYAMKSLQPEEFNKLTKSYIECRYPDNRVEESFMDTLLTATGCRAIDYLLEKNDPEISKDYLNFLREKIVTGPFQLMRSMIVPSEELAVLCHGDFCRNNILFKYANGVPIDCRLFDFQTYRYGNPSLDLTFFLYLNSTLELREKHYEELLSTYHETLTKTVSQLTGRSLAEIIQLYPKALFHKDFCEHSIWGYLIVSFFVPMMMAPDDGFDEAEFENNTPEQMAKKSVERGGEAVTLRITEVIRDMFRKKCYFSEMDSK